MKDIIKSILREFQLTESGDRPTLKEATIWIIKLCQIAVGGVVIKTGYDYLHTDLLTAFFVMAIGIYFVFSNPVLK